MKGFALGAAEVGRAFQLVVEKVGRGSQHRGSTGVLPTDDAPSDSGGTVVSRKTLQVTVGVPVTWGRGKENELLGSEGIG